MLTVSKIHCKDLTGITPRKAKSSLEGKDADSKPAAGEEATSTESNVSPAQQQLFKSMFTEYYKSLEAHLIRDHKVR